MNNISRTHTLRIKRLIQYLRLHPGEHSTRVYRYTGVAWDEAGHDIISRRSDGACYVNEDKLKDYLKQLEEK